MNLFDNGFNFKSKMEDKILIASEKCIYVRDCENKILCADYTVLYIVRQIKHPDVPKVL